MIGYIYKIVNSVNDKVYIGKTNNLYSRWNGHKSSVKNNRSNSRLPLAMKKYGFDKFSLSPILTVLDYKKDADYFEKLLIAEYDSYKTGYNSTKGGESVPLGNRERVKVVGKRFGHWVILEELPDKDYGNYSRRVVLCKCDCGKVKQRDLQNLVSGNSLSCGCSKPRAYNRQDHRGERFGHLVVIKDDINRHDRKVTCLCDCGTVKRITLHAIISGRIKTCGCKMHKPIKKVSVRGVVYASYRDAAKQLGVNEKTVRRWMKSKPTEVFYLDTPPQPEV